jgi:curli biogenesis system outer membrane secretion channel CsgG
MRITTNTSILIIMLLILSCATSDEYFTADVDFSSYSRIAVLSLTDFPTAPGSGTQVADIVSMKLLTTNLTILDRSQTSAILNEQKIGSTGLIDGDTAPEIGKILGVQAILTGSVGEFGTKTVDIQIVQGGRPAPMDIAGVSIILKLIDCETGQIIWAGSARGTQIGAHGESSAASKAVTELIKNFRRHF